MNPSYIKIGATKTPIEFEQKKSKATLYNLSEIAETLKTGQTFVLSEKVTIVTVFKILQELRKQGNKKATYGKVKGTAHNLITKNGRTYVSYQYAIFNGNEEYKPRVIQEKK
jgi:hypothetical protein